VFHSDLPWLVRSYFARFKRKAKDPRAWTLVAEGDIRLATRRALFVQPFLLLIPYSAASFEMLTGGDGFGPARGIVAVMWPVWLAAYLAASFLLPRTRDALLAQAAHAARGLPLSIASLSVGGQMMMYLIGPSAMVAMLVSVGLTALLLWRGIISGRARFYDKLGKRRYRRLLRDETHNWDATFSIEQPLGSVGCIGIGASISGPAIGMHLDEMIGRPSANIVMGIVLFFIGLLTLHALGYQTGVYLIEMRRIELRLGRRLRLAPYRRADEPRVT
jgi:hypothetical protein